MRFIRILVLGIFGLCSGCSLTLTKTRFYIESESLPVITNDSNYGKDQKINNRIIVNRNKVEVQRIYTF